MNMVNEEIVKAMGIFGGGISRSQRICGCLSGAVALVSTIYSRGNLDGKEDPRMFELGEKLIAAFDDLTREYGGPNCSDIARTDWHDKAQARYFMKDPNGRRKICVKLVGDTAHALGKILDDEVLNRK